MLLTYERYKRPQQAKQLTKQTMQAKVNYLLSRNTGVMRRNLTNKRFRSGKCQNGTHATTSNPTILENSGFGLSQGFLDLRNRSAPSHIQLFSQIFALALMVLIVLLFIWVPYMATHEPPHQNFFYITARLEKLPTPHIHKLHCLGFPSL